MITLEVLSKESNATNWIISGLNRHKLQSTDYTDNIVSICKEVANELQFTFEHKENNIMSFTDKDLS